MINKFICFIFLIICLFNKNYSVYGNVNSNNNINDNNNDNEIQVFLIPHTHLDVGWVETVEQYFTLNVTLILNNIIRELSDDPTKKFNWAEIIYFERWYNLQNDQTKDRVKSLIASKQLYFIGGGWAQNDEAVTDYQAVINQMTLGHQFLYNEFGVTPTIGWQIDPFGPSTLTPTLFSQMGFKYHVINRIDERIKYVFNVSQMNISGSGVMTTEKEFEFIWYPSASNSNISIFTHVLDHHYSPPFMTVTNYIFPSFSYTTGFNFEAGGGENPLITSSNLVARSEILVEIIQQRAALFRHNNLLLPFGNDFAYQNSQIEFNNMDKLINYINANKKYGINIRYATLDEYFDAIFNSNSDNSSSSSNNNKDYSHESIEFPKLSSEDYFVYTQCVYQSTLTQYRTCANYWSGYYSSYAELKQVVRKSDSLLRTAEMLYSLASNKLMIENDNSFDLEQVYNTIVQHRNVSAILTHHDAITGTSKNAVRANYMQMLLNSEYETSLYVLPGLVGLLLSNQTINLDYSTNNTIIDNDAKVGDIYAISFTNSLGWDRYEYIEIQVPESIKVAVYDYDSNSVLSQLVQRMDKNGNWYLYTQVKTPALGISTYFIIIVDSENDEIRNQEILNLIQLKIIAQPAISQVVYSNEITLDSDSTISIGNTLFNLNFKININNNGLLGLYSFDDLQNNKPSIPLSQSYVEYTSYSDSQYTFRPIGQPVNLEPTISKSYISNGTLVKIITIIYTSNCSQSYIVYNSNTTLNETINQEQFFEIDNIVAAEANKEVASKFITSINNNNQFYTSNGLEMMKREFRILFDDNQPWSVISSNFFPTINTVQLVDQSTLNQLTVLTRQSMAVSSQHNGELDLLYVRRSDSIGATLNEKMNDISNPLIKIKVFFGNQDKIESIRTPHSLILENPLLPIYSTVNDISIDKWKSMYNTLYKPFDESLPLNLHLLSFMKPNLTDSTSNSTNYFIRLLNIYELNQSDEFSQPIEFSINNYFNFLTNISKIQETSLSINSIINQINNDQLITINPLDIKSYLLNINKQ